MKAPDFSLFPVLETDRLVLRKLVLSDAPEIYRLRSDLAVAALTGIVPSLNIDDAIAHINKIEKLVFENVSVYWAISYKQDPALIGTICLWNLDIQGETAEIGYELLPEFRGKGLAAEAIKCVTRFGFDKMEAKSIIGFPAEANTPSVKLLEKLGFRLSENDQQNEHTNVAGLLTFVLDRETN
ncbi:MAG TPA: GNAT family N-acetyltransferase [Pedobacter sp.]|uniref:GNAT family N-acetyltransferase n=1 Tax=Pedobacter sp. TaxID=1411316 RepID=UPI002CDEF70E|nr:GNAT family N-acetyltransferase [Pedobacter sp.]HMI05544.1 GNAT family N-acetyltransferase [Pedobacter sp.]